jgi:UDP-2,3-diacylglucosamine pyrophosphatase LpxH
MHMQPPVMPSNLLIVSDLHFGEDLLPGASLEKRRAVGLGATAFCDFLRHHGQRRLDGKPWRLVVAGDLFDFMSVTLAAHGELPARNGDERWAGRTRSLAAGPARMREIGEAHRAVLTAMVRFTAAGNEIDLIVGNHDLELLEDATAAELRRQLAEVAAGLAIAEPAAALARLRVQPWFVYLPGVAWIEHGHVYDEACSFELNQAPFDPQSGELIANVDNAAVRYLAQAAPELDPHGTEEWGFSGYVRYAMSRGPGSFVRLLAGYARFTSALLGARRQHRSVRRRRARHELHRRRVAAIAADQRLELGAVQAIDRLARAPVTKSARRLFAMLMLDRWLSLLGGGLASLISLLVLPLPAALLVVAAALAVFIHIGRRSAASTVGSQVPMLAVPERIRRHVDAPVVVFGHTHDPRRLELADGGVYLNTGTWLPASRPGILRSFTHVLVRAPASGGAPVAEIRQWRDGRSVPFVEPVGGLALGSLGRAAEGTPVPVGLGLVDEIGRAHV